MSIERRDPKLERISEAGKQKKPLPEKPVFPIPKGSHLISFGNRVTFTFAYGQEVGSIHFDMNRNEIFYKGHNIRHMEMEPQQMQQLERMREVLKSDQRTRHFSEPYGTLLDKIILEKSKAHRSSP